MRVWGIDCDEWWYTMNYWCNVIYDMAMTRTEVFKLLVSRLLSFMGKSSLQVRWFTSKIGNIHFICIIILLVNVGYLLQELTSWDNVKEISADIDEIQDVELNLSAVCFLSVQTNTLWRNNMETPSVLLAQCEGIHRWLAVSPHRSTVMRAFDIPCR